MKVKKVYNENKKIYIDYVIMIKIGIFYETYNNDALIINKLFKYKVKKIGDFDRVGFPINSYDKVIKKLNECKINYVVIDGGTFSKKFLKNNYKKYLSNNYTGRIDDICDRLNNLIFTSNIDDILLKIESLL